MSTAGIKKTYNSNGVLCIVLSRSGRELALCPLRKEMSFYASGSPRTAVSLQFPDSQVDVKERNPAGDPVCKVVVEQDIFVLVPFLSTGSPVQDHTDRQRPVG